MTLDDEDVEAIAERVAEKLVGGARAERALVDVATVARVLGVSLDFVYAHAQELGGVKVGNGPKARWRFDLAVTAATVAAAPEPPPVKRRRASSARPRMPAEGPDLIPLRADGPAA